MLKGIDVSRYQRFDDYTILNHSKRAFVFIKASEGLYTDPSFKTHCEGFSKTCLLAGAYHFLRFRDSGVDQANHFIDVVKPAVTAGKLQLPAVLDIEDDKENKSPQECEKIINDWLQTVQTEFGKTPIIYTGGWYWRDENHLNDTTSFSSKYPLWTSRYHKTKYEPMYGGWSKPMFWQWTDKGSIDGLESAIDEDYFMSDMQALWDLAKLTPATLPKDKVYAAQAMLNSKKFFTGPPDGAFGSVSIAAYQDWQQSKGLNVIKDLNANYWQLLFDIEAISYGTSGEVAVPVSAEAKPTGRTAVVTANLLNIRARPEIAEDNKVALPLTRGQKVVVIEESDEWCKVKTDLFGWVAKTFVS
jgi:lysozyme